MEAINMLAAACDKAQPRAAASPQREVAISPRSRMKADSEEAGCGGLIDWRYGGGCRCIMILRRDAMRVATAMRVDIRPASSDQRIGILIHARHGRRYK